MIRAKSATKQGTFGRQSWPFLRRFAVIFEVLCLRREEAACKIPMFARKYLSYEPLLDECNGCNFFAYNWKRPAYS